MKNLIALLIACFVLSGCMSKQQVTLEQKMSLCQQYGMVYQILVLDQDKDVVCYSEKEQYFVYMELIPEKQIRKTGY